jgi:hypothetical protein
MQTVGEKRYLTICNLGLGRSITSYTQWWSVSNYLDSSKEVGRLRVKPGAMHFW